MFAAANMAAQKPPGGFLQGFFWSRAGQVICSQAKKVLPAAARRPGPSGFNRPFLWSRAGSNVTLHPYCAPAPGRLFAARQRKFCQRRLAARGQVDSTGPRAIIQRSQLCLLRQRWLPCAKGAVGERRLKDWQRGHPACPARERSMPAAARRSPPCAKGGQHGKAMLGGL